MQSKGECQPERLGCVRIVLVRMLELVYSFIIVISTAVLILSLFVSRFTLYRHTCKLLKDHSLGNIHKCAIIGFSRTIRLILSCALPNHIQDPIYNSEFKISRYATRFEKVVAYLFVIGMSNLLICMIFYYLTKWLGILEWSF